MPNNKSILLLLPLFVLLGACEKDEPLWKLPPAGNETVASVDMGSNYDNAIFFSLKTGATQIRDVYSWHLAFATGSTENHIIINGGNEVQIYQTKDTTFDKTYKVEKSTEWIWDNPNGKVDSTAFAGWLDTLTQTTRNKVYIVDLGSKATTRYQKLKVLSVTGSDFNIQYANLDGSQLRVITVPKISGSNYTYLNLESGAQVQYEPNEKDWNIIFTKYRYVYYDMTPITPYYVTGALINTKHTQIIEQDGIDFESLDYTKANTLLLTDKMDEIGYDWKRFDFTTERYLVDDKKIYIIKDAEGFLYKLKFIGFYDEKTGAKGVPQFVYKRL